MFIAGFVAGYNQPPAPQLAHILSGLSASEAVDQHWNGTGAVAEDTHSFRKVSLNVSVHPYARCSDGSPGTFYYKNATRQGPGTHKWMILLYGGATCGEREYCMRDRDAFRPKAKKNAKDPLLPGDNPLNRYANWGWHDVQVPYCSLDFWTGRRTQATDETFGLYFSGQHIVEGVLSALDRFYGLGDATEIVFMGMSGGSVGVFHYLDAMAKRYPNARVSGVMLSGFYFYGYPYTGPGSTGTSPHGDLNREALPALYNLWDSGVDASCAAAMGSQEAWRCLLPNNSYPYVITPKFIAQAQSDSALITQHSWMPGNEMHRSDGTLIKQSELSQPMRTYLQDWSQNMSIALEAPMASALDGVWSPACYEHREFERTSVGGMSCVEAFISWYHGHRVKKQDACGVMCNPTCNLKCEIDSHLKCL